MKAIKIELLPDSDYQKNFDCIPGYLTEMLEKGYFDDNGDLPQGNCILIPVCDLVYFNRDIELWPFDKYSEYESGFIDALSVNFSGVENIVEYMIDPDATVNESGKFNFVENTMYMGYVSSKKLIIEI